MKKSNTQMPVHVGLIVDGIRRWFRRENITYLDGYWKAWQILADVISFLFNSDVPIVSAYMHSKNNLRRDKSLVSQIHTSELRFLEEIISNLVSRYNCKVELAADSSLLPYELRNSVLGLTEATKLYTEHKLYLLIAYSPVDEILHSNLQRTQNFIQTLWVKEPVDLIIRTGGVQRLSNFLPLQSGYAELFFLEKFWNDLILDDIDQVMNEFYKRQRTFGK